MALFSTLPAAAQDAVSLWPSAPFKAESFTTIQGKRIGPATLSLTTPERLDPTSAGDIFQFKAAPSEPPLRWVREITGAPTRIDVLGSEPGIAQTFTLGSALSPAPPPPDWARASGASGAWSPADPAEVGALAPYLPHASEIWLNAKASKIAPDDREEGLIRQRLNAPPGRIARAILRIAGRAEFLDIRVNDRPALIGGDRAVGLAEFEVTPLVRPGENLVALRVQTPAGERVRRPSVAFHLEIWTTPPDPKADRAPRPWEDGSCLVVQRDGGRVWGHFARMDDRVITLATQGGEMTVTWPEVFALIFPGGWTADANAPADKNWLQKKMRPTRRASRRPPADSLQLYGAPLSLSPMKLEGRAYLKDGRAVRGTPVYYADGKLALETASGRRAEIDAAQVVAIFPDSDSAGDVQVKATKAYGPLYASLQTRDGDAITGLLRRLYSRGALIESANGDFIKIDRDEVASIQLTRAGIHDLERGAPRPARIGILGRAAGLDEFDDEYQLLSHALQRAAITADIESTPIETRRLRPGGLNPSDFGVIAMLDPVGEYPDSIETEGDARRAFTEYVEQGGTLLLYSRGGALRTAIVTTDSGLSRSVVEEGLAHNLGLMTIHPGEDASAVATAFERIPSGRATPEFALTDFGRDLDLAAPQTYLPPAGSESAFIPMISTEGAGQTIYALRGPDGKSLGPALQVIERGRGRIIIIDDLLWRATTDNEPFTRRTLPALLSWLIAE